MKEYDDRLSELKEKVMRLEYELEEKSSELLTLKKENTKLYDSVKQSVEQVGTFKAELAKDKAFYTEKIAQLAKEKAELSGELDILKIDYEKHTTIYDTVAQARSEMDRESLRLMDEVREKSMDAVTVIDYVIRDIAKMKLDLDNLHRAENASESDVHDEIQLMLDLLNKHMAYMGTIKSGFYKLNNITEYENRFDDLSLTRTETTIIDGNYVD